MKTFVRVIAIPILAAVLAINANAEGRLIVKYKPTSSQASLLAQGALSNSQLTRQMMQPLSTSTLSSIAAITGYQISEIKPTAMGAHVISVNASLTKQELQQLVAQLKQQPNIEYVEVDQLMQPNVVPPYNPLQWDMLESNIMPNIGAAYGDDFSTAWNLWDNNHQESIGSGVVVAVIDTGYTPHTNIINNLLPYTTESCVSDNGVGQCYGYQFISDCRIAGSCRANQSTNTTLQPQPDGLDLGDFISFSDTQNSFFSSCEIHQSSWHGSHVSGTVVANGFNSNTNSGILGGAYGAKVLPLRALGKCGGYLSDIVDAMLYAVNLYPGLTNSHPANIINMSLGGAGVCNGSSIMQGAINEVTAHGAIVVVSAGNNTQNISGFTPAGCSGVVSVAAKGLHNQLASYSNFGNTTITASGGSFEAQLPLPHTELILSTIWNSPAAFNFSDGESFAYYQGTSMAAPHVSAALADMIGLLAAESVSYDNTTLVSILQNSASFDYLNGSASNAGGSVATGMLDVGAAFNYIESNLFEHNLTPSTNSVALVIGSAPAIVTFTNNSDSAIEVESVQLLSITTVQVIADGCSATTVAPDSSCSITIATNNLDSGVNEGSVRLFDTSNNVLATVAISTSKPSASGGGGGGCSAVSGSKDDGMLFILFGLAIYYVWRKKKSANNNPVQDVV